MGLLPMDTVFKGAKTRTRVEGRFLEVTGALSALSQIELEGYEIHMGECTRKENAKPLVTITDKVNGDSKADGTYKDNVYGSYVHGIFDKEEVAEAVVTSIGKKKGLDVSEMTGVDFAEYKENSMTCLQMV